MPLRRSCSYPASCNSAVGHTLHSFLKWDRRSLCSNGPSMPSVCSRWICASEGKIIIDAERMTKLVQSKKRPTNHSSNTPIYLRSSPPLPRICLPLLSSTELAYDVTDHRHQDTQSENCQVCRIQDYHAESLLRIHRRSNRLDPLRSADHFETERTYLKANGGVESLFTVSRSTCSWCSTRSDCCQRWHSSAEEKKHGSHEPHHTRCCLTPAS